MKLIGKVFTLSLFVAFGAHAGWIPSPGVACSSNNAAYLTVKNVQVFPNASGTAYIYLWFTEYSNGAYFRYSYNGTSATAVQQAQMVLSTILQAKAAGGTKLAMYSTNHCQSGPIPDNSMTDINVVQLKVMPHSEYADDFVVRSSLSVVRSS